MSFKVMVMKHGDRRKGRRIALCWRLEGSLSKRDGLVKSDFCGMEGCDTTVGGQNGCREVN